MKPEKETGIDVLSTGVLGIDWLTGLGGLPVGTVCEFFGSESSGKTTLALHILKSAQDAGLPVGFVDADFRLNREQVENVGIVLGRLAVCQPESADDVLGAAQGLLARGGVVVLDSLASVVSTAELLGEVDYACPLETLGRVMSDLDGAAKRYGALLVVTNQIRTSFRHRPLGSCITTPGGLLPKAKAALRFELERVGASSPYERRRSWHTVKIVKNRFRASDRGFYTFEVGSKGEIRAAADLLELGLIARLIEKTGTSFYYGNERLGIGRDYALETLENHPSIREEIRDHLLRTLYPPESIDRLPTSGPGLE